MTYYRAPKYASRDATRGAWVTCDVCGFIWSMCDMSFQYDFLGGSTPVSTHVLKCPKCINDLRWQAKLIIIPPDPPPLFNTRPETYTIDETNFLTTQDGDIIDTESGKSYITSVANPADDANTALLSCSMSYPSGSVAALFLDLFVGNPASGGVSILNAITGSSTRIDLTGLLGTLDTNIAVNPSPIVITSSAEIISNVQYAAVYAASSGGSILASGPVSVAGQSIVQGAAVRFAGGALSIDLN
jgi:hypothetical protein